MISGVGITRLRKLALASVFANDVGVGDLIVTADLVDCVSRPVELEHGQEVVDDVLDRYRLGKRLDPARGGDEWQMLDQARARSRTRRCRSR